MTPEPVERRLRLEGQSGPVSVVLPDFPVRHGRAPNRFRYAYPDLGAEFMPLLLEQVPRTRRSGPPWRRTSRCGTCGEALGEPRDEPLRLSVDVKRVPTIHAEITMPGYACASCRRVSFDLDRTLEYHIAEAAVVAFKAGGVAAG